MSNQQEDKIVQEGPIMRAMMMSPAAAPLRMHSTPPVAKQPLAARSGGSAVQTQRSSAKSPVSWKIEETTVLPLPSIYILERTHTTVNDSPVEIAQRIANCLRQESISANFVSREALFEAETRDCVRFIVRLWRKGNDPQVIVEAHKVDGCCLGYCQAAKAVLRAAKGQPAAPKRSYPLPSCVPREAEAVHKAEIESGLEIASALLKKNRTDSHMMAIDTLLHLSKTSHNPALCANAILCGEFRSTLVCLIECGRVDREQAEMHLGEVEKHYVATMHRNALAVVANCLKSLQESKEIAQVLAQQEELASDAFLAALLEDVSASAERPHEACEAARCLRPLMCASNAIRVKVLQMGAQDAVASAKLQGSCRHALLEDACTKLQCEI